MLDTHILLALIERQTVKFPAFIRYLLDAPASAFHVSVATLWEIAIKSRLGKLELKPALAALPDLLGGMKIELLPINEFHVLAAVQPQPATRDPFDRLLLAQCQIENMRLMTIDRALVGHPLACQPGG